MKNFEIIYQKYQMISKRQNILEQAKSYLLIFVLWCDFKLINHYIKIMITMKRKHIKMTKSELTSGKGYKEKDKGFNRLWSQYYKEKIVNKTASEPQKNNIDRHYVSKLLTNNDIEPNLLQELNIHFRVCLNILKPSYWIIEIKWWTRWTRRKRKDDIN